MSQYVGGIRARLIHDNIYHLIKDGVGELGWLDKSTSRRDVTVLSQPLDNDEAAQPNLVILATEDIFEFEREMGSNLAEHRWDYYVDVYAEDNILGMHLATDIKDILMGRFNETVSKVGPNVAVYDLSVQSATPQQIFTVEIEAMDLNRGRFAEKPYQKYWWMLSFTVVDEYGTETY